MIHCSEKHFVALLNAKYGLGWSRIATVSITALNWVLLTLEVRNFNVEEHLVKKQIVNTLLMKSKICIFEAGMFLLPGFKYSFFSSMA